MSTLSKLYALTTASIIGTFFISPPVKADEVRVAVAANFVTPMRDISVAFTQSTGHIVRLTPGATGKFYAQIKNGAPFDVFLSADNETPERLEAENAAVSGTRFTYAIGQLVLWSPNTNYVDSNGAVLTSGKFQHIAIANPKVAPYGQAAQQVMERLGVWSNLQPKIVRGENIAQTNQFVTSGNAELGFVALSQVLVNGNISGSYWSIPKSYYQSIVQQAVLLNNGRGKPAAEQLMTFLRGSAASAIIKKYGYGLAH